MSSDPAAISTYDTPSEVEEIQLEGYRAMPPAVKLDRVRDLNLLGESLAETRLQRRYGPGLSQRELQLRLAALRLSRETMVQVFAWDPEVEGL